SDRQASPCRYPWDRSGARHGPAGPSERSREERARRGPDRPAPDFPAAPSGNLEPEPRLHGSPHPGPGGGLVARGIDDDATLGCGSGDGEKALPQRLVEAPVHPFIAILGPAPRGGTAEALL